MTTNEGTATAVAKTGGDEITSQSDLDPNRDPRPTREKLQNPAAFDAASSLYHDTADARAALKESFGRTILASKAEGF
jgi:hypothetical protein